MPFLVPIQIFLKQHGSYPLSFMCTKQAEIIYFTYVHPRNKMISDMPMLFQEYEGKLHENLNLIAFPL